MGPSSGLAAVAASAVLAAGITGEQDVASFVAGITLASGILFLLLAVLEDGLDRAVPLPGRGHRLPVRRGDRRRDRRAAQAHRDRRQRLQLRSRSCGRGWGPWARRTRPRWSWASSRWSSSSGCRRVAPRVPGALVLVVGGLLGSVAVRTSASDGVALVGDVPERAAVARRSRTCRLMWDHAGTVALAAVALVLIGFSQTAGDARAFAAKHRYQIDINQESRRPGRGQHRRGSAPGHARLDQPVRELAERPLGRPDRAGLAHLRRHRPAHAARPGAAVLRPAQAGAGGADHRGGRDGHDGRARDAPAGPGAAVRLLDRASRRSSAPCSSACSPAW